MSCYSGTIKGCRKNTKCSSPGSKKTADGEGKGLHDPCSLENIKPNSNQIKCCLNLQNGLALVEHQYAPFALARKNNGNQ